MAVMTKKELIEFRRRYTASMPGQSGEVYKVANSHINMFGQVEALERTLKSYMQLVVAFGGSSFLHDAERGKRLKDPKILSCDMTMLRQVEEELHGPTI